MEVKLEGQKGALRRRKKKTSENFFYLTSRLRFSASKSTNWGRAVSTLVGLAGCQIFVGLTSAKFFFFFFFSLTLPT